jgi:hypothetical protein
MIDLTTIGIAAVAIWSAMQQYQINKMCSKCPFLPKNSEEWTKKENIPTQKT